MTRIVSLASKPGRRDHHLNGRAQRVTIYALRSFASSGRIVAAQRLSAEDDEEALSMARVMVKGASAVARFDLWQGERHVEGKSAHGEERKAPAVRATVTAPGPGGST